MVCENIATGIGGILQCFGTAFSNDITALALLTLLCLALLMYYFSIPAKLSLGFGVALLFLFSAININNIFSQLFVFSMLIVAWVIIGGFSRAHKDSG